MQKEAMDYVETHPGAFLKLTGEKSCGSGRSRRKIGCVPLGAAEAIVFEDFTWPAGRRCGLCAWGFIVGRPGKEYLLLLIYFCFFFRSSTA